MSKFEDIVRQRQNVGQCINQFKSTISLDKKIDDYNNHKFTRYFYNHKGRTIFIIFCIILLFVCALTEYPIDGSINSDSTVSKFMSVVGFIAANVFLALLFTILGVETFMSREELNEIKIELPKVIEEEIKKNKSKPGFMEYLQTKLSKLTRQKSNKYLSKIAVSDQDKLGEAKIAVSDQDKLGEAKIAVSDQVRLGRGVEDIDLCDIKFMLYSSLSVDQLTQLYEDIKKA